VPSVQFDAKELVEKLNEVSPHGRAIFAAACAERLFPAYLCFVKETQEGAPAALRDALSRLWDDLAGKSMSTLELSASAERCRALVPGEEPWADSQPRAEAAVVAVVYALECRRDGRGEQASFAASRA
jgi:uncharacterized protein YjaG (DUF416 family)